MVKSALLRWAGVVLSVLALAFGAGTSPASAASGKTTDAAWRVASVLARGTENTSVACPTATSCVAVEAGQLVSSSDGGATWTDRTPRVPAAVDNLVDVACPSSTKCYATATNADGSQSLLVFNDSTRSIVSLPVPAPAPLTELSCAGPKHCMASDGATAYVTLDGGATWVSRALGDTLRGGFGLTCLAGTTTCFTVGERASNAIGFRTDDDGATWVYEPMPTELAALYDVTCPSATTCYAGGALFPSGQGGIARTTNGGATWSMTAVPTAFPLESISCATSTTCIATGARSFALRTTDGQTWSSIDLGVDTSSSDAQVACPTSTHCVAMAAGKADVSDDAGLTWSRVELSAGTELPRALSCPPSSTTCVGVGVDTAGRALALTSSDNGTTWVTHRFPAGAGVPSDVSCPSVAVCVAVARYDVPGTNRILSQAYRSTDAGVTWKAGRVSSPSGAFTELSCSSATTCMALGWDMRSSAKTSVTTDGGRTWAPATVPEPQASSHSLSCTASTGCVVVSVSVRWNGSSATAWVSADLGKNWQSHALPSGEFFDVDCSGPTCVAVGHDVNRNQQVARSADGGATWATMSIPGTASSAYEVACGTPSVCVMSGGDQGVGRPTVVRTTSDGGATWTPHPIAARNQMAGGLTCRATTCWAVDTSVTARPQVYTNAP